MSIHTDRDGIVTPLVYPSTPDATWAPLSNLLGVDHTNRGTFMFMGKVNAGKGSNWTATGDYAPDVEIYLYKHCDTRRYLNVGSDNRCYRYDYQPGPNEKPGVYVPIPTLEAINYAFS